jgi:hypothetical protein
MSFDIKQNDDGSTSFISDLTGKTALHLDAKYGMRPGIRDYVSLYDDFLGDVLDDQWSGAKGTDAEGVAPAIVAGGLNGICRLVAGDDNAGGMAASGSSLTQALNWKPSQGGLYMEARVNFVTISGVVVNVGFTDVLATTTLEMPFTISGTTITSNATDAACFVFDTSADNDTLHILGVKNDVDTAINNTAVVPGSGGAYANYLRLGIAIDASGNAEFFINGASYGVVANAVTASTALTPIIAVDCNANATKTFDVDYIFVAQSR